MDLREQKSRLITYYINRPARCVYHDSVRLGKIVNVKQGPCFPTKSGTFEFAEKTWGAIYIMWEERRTGRVKSFKWELVSDFRLLTSAEVDELNRPTPTELTESAVTVPRMRPTL